MNSILKLVTTLLIKRVAEHIQHRQEHPKEQPKRAKKMIVPGTRIQFIRDAQLSNDAAFLFKSSFVRCSASKQFVAKDTRGLCVAKMDHAVMVLLETMQHGWINQEYVEKYE